MSVESARKRIRLPRAYDAAAVQERSRVDTTKEGCIVQQQFRDEVDVNTIVRRFGLPEAPVHLPAGVFGDFTGVTDYESAAAKVAAVGDAFRALPPQVRERFGNDPGRFAVEAAGWSDEDLAALVAPPPAPVPPAMEASGGVGSGGSGAGASAPA